MGFTVLPALCFTTTKFDEIHRHSFGIAEIWRKATPHINRIKWKTKTFTSMSIKEENYYHPFRINVYSINALQCSEFNFLLHKILMHFDHSVHIFMGELVRSFPKVLWNSFDTNRQNRTMKWTRKEKETYQLHSLLPWKRKMCVQKTIKCNASVGSCFVW